MFAACKAKTISFHIFFDLVAVMQILNTPDFFHDVIHKPFTRQMS
jgi:hypothetical protein